MTKSTACRESVGCGESCVRLGLYPQLRRGLRLGLYGRLCLLRVNLAIHQSNLARSDQFTHILTAPTLTFGEF
ncbi:hypothetical protein [uncultured Endozoicomonas sp.]|uniref:hypothetical protein n=1 Tax=uncultured Endozoicomonas sp. TaxID=432652 RepID=UPI00260C9ABD|nr:hypothetical protein [uncultured Endozoicomonas sp.]